MSLIVPRLICCDEAGFTGNNMLDPDQPYFSYASHDLSVNEAAELIEDLRGRHSIQMPELKAAKLLKTPRGRRLLTDALDQIQGRYIASIYEKKLSLAAKLFEYFYEPVLARNNALFYHHNLTGSWRCISMCRCGPTRSRA